MRGITLTYSLADQNFDRTKSLGIFNVSTQLLENLSRSEGLEHIDVLSNSTLKDRLDLPQKVRLGYHDEAVSGWLGRIIWDQFGAYKAARKIGNEWLFLPKGFASFMKSPDTKLAVYSYDTMHEFYRANYPKAMPHMESMYFSRSLKASLKYADVIFTDSDFARAELMRLAQRLKVEPPLMMTAGIGFNRANRVNVSKTNSVLFLTSAWPHKLTKVGIEHLEQWQKNTGFKGTIDMVGSLPDSVKFPRDRGWNHCARLSEGQYKQYLSRSKILVFFTAYEGFGMPPIEAVISGGCPVFSDIEVTREVMADVGCAFKNNSFASFEAAMNRAMDTTDREIELWAEQLLVRYRWDKIVARVLKGLEMAGKI
jgi:glycosyltransferase involved in cell wall biosynthesis